MAKIIPLIRAAVLLPVVRWMEVSSWHVEDRLADSDLDYWPGLVLDDAIPVLSAIQFLRDAARTAGPDLGYRIVTEASIREIAFIGRVAMGARNPREGLLRVSAAMPLHSSHEDIVVSKRKGGDVVRESWRLKLDAESLHTVHVYVASLIQQLCRFTGLRPPFFSHVEVQAHPEFGVAHLDACFGIPVVPAKGGVLTIVLADRVAHVRFRTVARDRRMMSGAQRIAPLAEDATLAGSMRPVIAAMLYSGEPTIERVARAGGMSVRTLQRRLTEEGTSFSVQLTVVRRRLANKLLLEHDATINDITTRLGYSSQSALTRAVRRWTGRTPSWIKDHAAQ